MKTNIVLPTDFRKDHPTWKAATKNVDPEILAEEMTVRLMVRLMVRKEERRRSERLARRERIAKMIPNLMKVEP